jgi:hypothetical protein
MLVVIAIICLLLALLFPIVIGLRDIARETICINNLRQLQVGMIAFAVDNSDRIPGTYEWVTNSPYEIYWGDGGRQNIKNGTLWPYVLEIKIYLCPSFKKAARTPPAGAEWRPGLPFGQGYSSVPTINPATYDVVRSYSLSMYADTAGTFHRMTQMTDRVFFADENPWRQDFYWGWSSAYGINNGHLATCDMPGSYHRKHTAYASMGDGHVEQLTAYQIYRNIGGANDWRAKLSP